jgi:hypothetical protein
MLVGAWIGLIVIDVLAIWTFGTLTAWIMSKIDKIKPWANGVASGAAAASLTHPILAFSLFLWAGSHDYWKGTWLNMICGPVIFLASFVPGILIGLAFARKKKAGVQSPVAAL